MTMDLWEKFISMEDMQWSWFVSLCLFFFFLWIKRARKASRSSL